MLDNHIKFLTGLGDVLFYPYFIYWGGIFCAPLPQDRVSCSSGWPWASDSPPLPPKMLGFNYMPSCLACFFYLNESINLRDYVIFSRFISKPVIVTSIPDLSNIYNLPNNVYSTPVLYMSFLWSLHLPVLLSPHPLWQGPSPGPCAC